MAKVKNLVTRDGACYPQGMALCLNLTLLTNKKGWPGMAKLIPGMAGAIPRHPLNETLASECVAIPRTLARS